MTARGTAALILVGAGLVVYLWLVEGPSGAPVAVSPSAGPVGALLGMRPDAVGRIELEDPGRRLAVRRTEEGWRDAQGRPWRGEAASDLLAALASLAPIMVVDPRPDDPTDYGLGPAASHLRLGDAAGRPLLELEVGGRNPAWTGVYARRGGSPEVVLVGALLHWELEKLRGSAPTR